MTINQVTICEHVNFINLLPVFAGIHLLRDVDVGGRDVMQQLLALKRYHELHETEDVTTKVLYRATKNKGRVYAMGGAMCQKMKKVLLRCVSSPSWFEFDVSACGPNILFSVVQNLNRTGAVNRERTAFGALHSFVGPGGCLHRIVNDRDTVIAELIAFYDFQDDFDGLRAPSRAECKGLIIAALNGSNHSGDHFRGWRLKGGLEIGQESDNLAIIQELRRFFKEFCDAVHSQKLTILGLKYQDAQRDISDRNAHFQAQADDTRKELQLDPFNQMLKDKLEQLEARLPSQNRTTLIQIVCHMLQNAEFLCMKVGLELFADDSQCRPVVFKHDAIIFEVEDISTSHLNEICQQLSDAIASAHGVKLTFKVQSFSFDDDARSWIEKLCSRISDVDRGVKRFHVEDPGDLVTKRRRFEENVDTAQMISQNFPHSILLPLSDNMILTGNHTYEFFVQSIAEWEVSLSDDARTTYGTHMEDLEFPYPAIHIFGALACISLHKKLDHLAILIDEFSQSCLDRLDGEILLNDAAASHFRETGFVFEVSKKPPARADEGIHLAKIKSYLSPNVCILPPTTQTSSYSVFVSILIDNALETYLVDKPELRAAIEQDGETKMVDHVARVVSTCMRCFPEPSIQPREGVIGFYDMYMNDLSKARSNPEYYLQRRPILAKFCPFNEQFLMRYCGFAQLIDRFFMFSTCKDSYVKIQYSPVVLFTLPEFDNAPIDHHQILFMKVVRAMKDIKQFIEMEGNFVIALSERQETVKGKPVAVKLRDSRLGEPLPRVNLLRNFLTTPSEIRTTMEEKLERGGMTRQYNGWYAHTFTAEELEDIMEQAQYGSISCIDSDLTDYFHATQSLRGGRATPDYGMYYILDSLTQMLGGGGTGSPEIRAAAVRDLRRFIAFTILFPNYLKKVMVYMKGPQGCGKDMLWQQVIGLCIGNKLLVGDEDYPSAILAVTTQEEFFPKNWNNHFEHLLLLVSTDSVHQVRAYAEQIKGQTTNEKFKLKTRYETDREISNRMSYVFLGNANHHFPAILDDGITLIIRRLLALECASISSYVPMNGHIQETIAKSAYRREIIDVFMDDIYNVCLSKYADTQGELRREFRKAVVKSILRWCFRHVGGITAAGLPIPTQTPFVNALMNYSKRRTADMIIDAVIDNLGPMILYICGQTIPDGYCHPDVVVDIFRQMFADDHNIYGEFVDPNCQENRFNHGFFLEEESLNLSINAVVPESKKQSVGTHDSVIRSALLDGGIIGQGAYATAFGGDVRETFYVAPFYRKSCNVKQFYLTFVTPSTKSPRIYYITSKHVTKLRDLMIARLLVQSAAVPSFEPPGESPH